MTLEDPAARRAARRSGALAGIGLLWVALLASLGLLWAALAAVAATSVGIGAVLLGTWRPRIHGASGARRGRRALAALRGAAARALAHLAAGMRRDAAALGRALAAARTGSAHALAHAAAGTRRDATVLGAWSRHAADRSRRDAAALAGWSRRVAARSATHARAAAGTPHRLAAAGDGRLEELRATEPPASAARPSFGARARAARSRVAAAVGGVERLRSRPSRATGHRLAHESVRRRREGDVDGAVTLARDAINAFRAVRDTHGEALALNTLALALAQGHRYAEAVDALDGALRLLAETGDRHREGTVLVNLGTLHRQAGGIESARFCWRKALERLDPASPESRETERLLRAS